MKPIPNTTIKDIWNLRIKLDILVSSRAHAKIRQYIRREVILTNSETLPVVTVRNSVRELIDERY